MKSAAGHRRGVRGRHRGSIDRSVRVRIRPTDYLTRGRSPQMIGALRKKIIGIEEHSIAFRAAFSDPGRTREDGSGEGIDETFDELDMLMEHLETCLGQFRTVARAEESFSPRRVSAVAQKTAKSE